jgi:hypothetical protein
MSQIKREETLVYRCSTLTLRKKNTFQNGYICSSGFFWTLLFKTSIHWTSTAVVKSCWSIPFQLLMPKAPFLPLSTKYVYQSPRSSCDGKDKLAFSYRYCLNSSVLSSEISALSCLTWTNPTKSLHNEIYHRTAPMRPTYSVILPRLSSPIFNLSKV